jgi:hypothetical protein
MISPFPATRFLAGCSRPPQRFAVLNAKPTEPRTRRWQPAQSQGHVAGVGGVERVSGITGRPCPGSQEFVPHLARKPCPGWLDVRSRPPSRPPCPPILARGMRGSRRTETEHAKKTARLAASQSAGAAPMRPTTTDQSRVASLSKRTTEGTLRPVSFGAAIGAKRLPQYQP